MQNIFNTCGEDLVMSFYFKENNKKVIRWPKKYSDIADIILSLNEDGSHEDPYLPFYDNYAGVLIVAASLGFTKSLQEDVGSSSSDTNEIRSDTFERSKFGQISLSYYMALIVFLHTRDRNMIREDRDDDMVKNFQRLAAGGLSYLRGAVFDRANSDRTGRVILQKEIASAIKAISP
jgi:hypothetical protein